MGNTVVGCLLKVFLDSSSNWTDKNSWLVHTFICVQENVTKTAAFTRQNKFILMLLISVSVVTFKNNHILYHVFVYLV